MPNRVDGNVTGAQPAAARPEARQPMPAAERQQAEGTARARAERQADRVEISQTGQERTAPARENTRGAALNAPGARPSPEIERREANLETQRETAVREEQDTARQQRTPPQRPGNLVDVTG